MVTNRIRTHISEKEEYDGKGWGGRKYRQKRYQTHPEIRYGERATYYQRGRKHVDLNAPKRHWTEAEEQKLMTADPNMFDKGLAMPLNRTVTVIQIRRSILLKKKLREASGKLVVIEAQDS